MEFIIANANKMEEGELPDSFSVDFDIGDTNDVEITCPRGSLAFGMYLICPGTEYGNGDMAGKCVPKIFAAIYH